MAAMNKSLAPFFVAYSTSTDLFVCAKDLFIAWRADGLIADEADRFDAAKAGIIVGQEQRPSDAPAWAW
jgi:hypothetical protein